MSTEHTVNSAIAIYRIDPLRRWSLYGCALLIAALPTSMLYWAESADGAGVAFITLLVMSPAILFLVFIGRWTRLELSADGIHSFNLGSSAQVAWHAVESLDLQVEATGIVLHAPSSQPGVRRMRGYANFAFSGTPFYSQAQRKLMTESRFIDLRAYRKQLRSDTFADDLRYYAPSLAPAVASQQAAALTAVPTSKAGLWLVLLVVLVPISISFYLGFADPLDFDSPDSIAPTFGLWLMRLFRVVLAAAFGLYSVVNIRTAWSQYSQRLWGSATLWLLFGLVQILFCAMLIADLQ